MSADSPIKVSSATKDMIRLGASIEDVTMERFVDQAVRAFLAAHRAQIEAGIENCKQVLGLNCPTCGRLPFGHAEGPNPTTRYLCAYCNEPAVLREEGVVVDRFSNVCHEDCLAKAVAASDPAPVTLLGNPRAVRP